MMGIKTRVAVVIKASIYAGFSVVICLREHSVFTAIRSFSYDFSYCMQRQFSSFFVLFWGYFLLKPCKMRDFGCLKDKNREKDMGKGRGRCEGSRSLFRGGILGVFLGFGRGGG